MELIIIVLSILFLGIIACLADQMKKLQEHINNCDIRVRFIDDRHTHYIENIWTYQSDIRTDFSLLLDHLKLEVTSIPERIIITKKKK